MDQPGEIDVVVPLVEVAEDHTAQKQSQECQQHYGQGEPADHHGNVVDGKGVTLVTPLGGKRKIGPLVGEGLPRIC